MGDNQGVKGGSEPTFEAPLTFSRVATASRPSTILTTFVA